MRTFKQAKSGLWEGTTQAALNRWGLPVRSLSRRGVGFRRGNTRAEQRSMARSLVSEAEQISIEEDNNNNIS